MQLSKSTSARELEKVFEVKLDSIDFTVNESSARKTAADLRLLVVKKKEKRKKRKKMVDYVEVFISRSGEID